MASFGVDYPLTYLSFAPVTIMSGIYGMNVSQISGTDANPNSVFRCSSCDECGDCSYLSRHKLGTNDA